MATRKVIISAFAALFLLAGCSQSGPKDSGPATTAISASSPVSTDVWKKQVARIIDLKDKDDATGNLSPHHLKPMKDDTSLIEMIFTELKAGRITAYSPTDLSLNTKLTPEQIKDLTAPTIDTVIITDPVTGKEKTVVTQQEVNSGDIHKYRILENWTFNHATGKTDIEIAGIAPIKEVYMPTGQLIGSKALFYLHYSDLHPIMKQLETLQPRKNLPSLIWDDYFLSDVKPVEQK